MREWQVDDVESPIQLAAIADDDNVIAKAGLDQRVAKLGTDAGRLPGRNDEWFSQRHT
jgi:hypothetical protein